MDSRTKTAVLVVCLVTLAVDTSRVPGGAAWSWLYLVSAVALVWWHVTRDYRSVRVFGAALSAVTWLRIVTFAYYDGFDRAAGIALNVIILVFAQGFVARRLPIARRGHR